MEDKSIKRILALNRINKKLRLLDKDDEESIPSNDSIISEELDKINDQQQSLNVKDNINHSNTSSDIALSHENLIESSDIDSELNEGLGSKEFSIPESDDENVDLGLLNHSESSDDDIFEEKKTCKKDANHMCKIIREKLRVWTINFCIVQTIVTALLLILNDVFP